MNPTLSRRVAKLMSEPAINDLPSEEHDTFINEVDEAPSFEDLSETSQNIILQAEQTAS